MKGINSLMRKKIFFLLKMRGTKLKDGILDIQSDRNVSFRWNEHGRQKKNGGSDVNVSSYIFFSRDFSQLFICVVSGECFSAGRECVHFEKRRWPKKKDGRGNGGPSRLNLPRGHVAATAVSSRWSRFGLFSIFWIKNQHAAP